MNVSTLDKLKVILASSDEYVVQVCARTMCAILQECKKNIVISNVTLLRYLIRINSYPHLFWSYMYIIIKYDVL